MSINFCSSGKVDKKMFICKFCESDVPRGLEDDLCYLPKNWNKLFALPISRQTETLSDNKTSDQKLRETSFRAYRGDKAITSRVAPTADVKPNSAKEVGLRTPGLRRFIRQKSAKRSFASKIKIWVTSRRSFASRFFASPHSAILS